MNQEYLKQIAKARLRIPSKLLPIRKKVRYKFAWGGRGGAKSESFARELLRIGNEKKIRVLCTREIQISIKDSVYTLLKDLIVKLHYYDYRCTENSIINERTRTEFIFMGMWQQEKKQTMKSLANIDYCWIEEAQTISEGSLKLLDPTIRKEGSEIWTSFNRLFDIDPIWIFKNKIEPHNKVEIEINYFDNPYLPEVLTQQAVRSKMEYEEGLSEDYLHVWLGNPVGQSEKTLLTLREVQDAIDREQILDGGYQVGADIARFGKDRTILFKRKGSSLVDYKVYNKTSVTDTFKYIVDFINNDTSIPVMVDDTGVGGGVTDLLEDYGFNSIPVNFGSRASNKDKYGNKISEMWFEFKENINNINLLDLPELKGELITREWKLDIKNRRQIESKDDYKKRGYRSPDMADACLLCFMKSDIYNPVFLGRIM